MAVTLTTGEYVDAPGQAPAQDNAAATLPTEQQPTPGPTFADAIRAARERLERGEDPFAPAAPAAPPQDAEQAPAGAVPQVPEGVYWDEAAQRYRDRATGNFVRVAADGTVAPEAASVEAGEAQPAAAAEAADEGAPEGGEIDERLIVRLRPRNGDEPVEIVVDDLETAEILRANINDGMRRAEFNRQMAEVQAQREELDYIYESLRLDPVNFIMDHVTKPEIRIELARYLLADPAVYDKVIEEYAQVDGDPDALDAKRAKLELERINRREQMRRELEEARAVQRNIRQVHQVLSELAEGLDEATANRFIQIAGRDLADYVRLHNLTMLDPAEVPLILKRLGTLDLFGLRPGAQGSASAPARAAGGAAAAYAQPGASGVPPARPKGPAEARIASSQAVQAQRVGEQFRAAHARRAAATAVAPAGVGATPLRVQPPKGQTVKERIAWARQHGLA